MPRGPGLNFPGQKLSLSDALDGRGDGGAIARWWRFGERAVGMDELAEYLDLIVEPTFADFRSNPWSARHAFLACVATFHAVDRAAHPRKPNSLREKWRKQSFEFLIVDMVAHHFKHVRSHDERPVPPGKGLPLSFAVFGRKNPVPSAMDLYLHNLHFVIRDAIRFVREQIPVAQ